MTSRDVGSGTPAIPASDLRLSSGLLAEGRRMPTRFTGDGEDLSPPLRWTGAPAGTQSFALICDDPDAPSPRRPNPEPWVHWVIYDIPATVVELPEGLPRTATLAAVGDARQGKNSWPRDNTGYRGPAPPPGSGTHRYIFRLLALDTRLDLGASPPTKTAVLAAARGHVLGEARLTVTYDR